MSGAGLCAKAAPGKSVAFLPADGVDVSTQPGGDGRNEAENRVI